MHQTHNRIAPDVPPSTRRLELEAEILRLQILVSHLIEKNEQLRRKVASSLGDETSFVTVKHVMSALV